MTIIHIIALIKTYSDQKIYITYTQAKRWHIMCSKQLQGRIALYDLNFISVLHCIYTYIYTTYLPADSKCMFGRILVMIIAGLVVKTCFNTALPKLQYMQIKEACISQRTLQFIVYSHM